MADSDEPMEVTLCTDVDPGGKGFTIAGGGTDGIIVSQIVKEHPHSNIFSIKEGDQLLSATIYFDNISYEDAIKILQHSEPYKVQFQLKRKLGREDRDKMQSMFHAKKEKQERKDVFATSESLQGDQAVRKREHKKKRSKKERLSWPKFQSLTNTRFLGHRRSRSTSETNEDETLEAYSKVTEATSEDDELFIMQQETQEFPGMEVHSRKVVLESQITDVKKLKEAQQRVKEKRSLDNTINVQVDQHSVLRSQIKKGYSLDSTISSSKEKPHVPPEVEVIIVKEKNLPSPCKVSPAPSRDLRTYEKSTTEHEQLDISDDTSSPTKKLTKDGKQRKKRTRKVKLGAVHGMELPGSEPNSDALNITRPTDFDVKTREVGIYTEKVSDDFIALKSHISGDSYLHLPGQKSSNLEMKDSEITVQLPIFQGPTFAVSEEQDIKVLESSTEERSSSQPSELSGWKLQMPIIKMPKLPKLHRKSLRSASTDQFEIITDKETDIKSIEIKDSPVFSERYVNVDQSSRMTTQKHQIGKSRTEIFAPKLDGNITLDEKLVEASIHIDPKERQTLNFDMDQKVSSIVGTVKPYSTIDHASLPSKPKGDPLGEMEVSHLRWELSKLIDDEIRTSSDFLQSEVGKSYTDFTPLNDMSSVDHLTQLEGQDKDDKHMDLDHQIKSVTTGDENRESFLRMPKFKMPSFGSFTKRVNEGTESRQIKKEETVDVNQDILEITNIEHKDMNLTGLETEDQQTADNKIKTSKKLPKIGISLPKFKGHKGHYDVSRMTEYLKDQDLNKYDNEIYEDTQVNILDSVQHDVSDTITAERTKVMEQKHNIEFPTSHMPKSIETEDKTFYETVSNLHDEDTLKMSYADIVRKESKETSNVKNWRIQMQSVKIPKVGILEKKSTDISTTSNESTDAHETDKTTISKRDTDEDKHFKMPTFKLPSLHLTGSIIKTSQLDASEQSEQTTSLEEDKTKETQSQKPDVTQEEDMEVDRKQELTSEVSDGEKHGSPFKLSSFKLPSFSKKGGASQEESKNENLEAVFEQPDVDNDTWITTGKIKSKKKKHTITKTKDMTDLEEVYKASVKQEDASMEDGSEADISVEEEKTKSELKKRKHSKIKIPKVELFSPFTGDDPHDMQKFKKTSISKTEEFAMDENYITSKLIEQSCDVTCISSDISSELLREQNKSISMMPLQQRELELKSQKPLEDIKKGDIEVSEIKVSPIDLAKNVEEQQNTLSTLVSTERSRVDIRTSKPGSRYKNIDNTEINIAQNEHIYQTQNKRNEELYGDYTPLDKKLLVTSEVEEDSSMKIDKKHSAKKSKGYFPKIKIPKLELLGANAKNKERIKDESSSLHVKDGSRIDSTTKSQDIDIITIAEQETTDVLNTKIDRIDLTEHKVRPERDVDTIDGKPLCVRAKDEEETVKDEIDASFRIQLSSFQEPILSNVDELESVVSQIISFRREEERNILQLVSMSGKPSEKSEAVHVDVTSIIPTHYVSSLTEETKLKQELPSEEVNIAEEWHDIDKDLKPKTTEVIAEVINVDKQSPTEEIVQGKKKVRKQKKEITKKEKTISPSKEIKLFVHQDDLKVTKPDTDVGQMDISDKTKETVQNSLFLDKSSKNKEEIKTEASENDKGSFGFTLPKFKIPLFSATEFKANEHCARTEAELQTVTAKNEEGSLGEEKVTSFKIQLTSFEEPILSNVDEIESVVSQLISFKKKDKRSVLHLEALSGKQSEKSEAVPVDPNVISPIQSLVKSQYMDTVATSKQLITDNITTKIDKVDLTEHLVKTGKDLNEEGFKQEKDSSTKIELSNIQAPIIGQVNGAEKNTETIAHTKKVERSVLQLGDLLKKLSEDSGPVKLGVTDILPIKSVSSLTEKNKIYSAEGFVGEVKKSREEELTTIEQTSIQKTQPDAELKTQSSKLQDNKKESETSKADTEDNDSRTQVTDDISLFEVKEKKGDIETVISEWNRTMFKLPKIPLFTTSEDDTRINFTGSSQKIENTTQAITDLPDSSEIFDLTEHIESTEMDLDMAEADLQCIVFKNNDKHIQEQTNSNNKMQISGFQASILSKDTENVSHRIPFTKEVGKSELKLKTKQLPEKSETVHVDLEVTLPTQSVSSVSGETKLDIVQNTMEEVKIKGDEVMTSLEKTLVQKVIKQPDVEQSAKTSKLQDVRIESETTIGSVEESESRTQGAENVSLSDGKQKKLNKDRVDLTDHKVKSERDLDITEDDLEKVTFRDEEKTDSTVKIQLQRFHAPILHNVDEIENTLSQTISITKKVERSVLQVDPLSGKPSEESEAVHVDVTVISPTQSVSSVTEETQFESAIKLVDNVKSQKEEVVKIIEQPSVEEDELDQDLKFETTEGLTEVVDADKQSQTEKSVTEKGKVRKHRKKITKVEKTVRTLSSSGTETQIPLVHSDSSISQTKTEVEEKQVKEISPDTEIIISVHQEIKEVTTPDADVGQLDTSVKERTIEKSVSVEDSSKVEEEEQIVGKEDDKQYTGWTLPTFKIPLFSATEVKIETYTQEQCETTTQPDVAVTHVELATQITTVQDEREESETSRADLADTDSKTETTADILLSQVEEKKEDTESAGWRLPTFKLPKISLFSTSEDDSRTDFTIKSQQEDTVTETEQLATVTTTTIDDTVDFTEHIVRVERELEVIEAELQSVTIKDVEETLEEQTDLSFKIQPASFQVPILSNIDDTQSFISQKISVIKEVERSMLQLEPVSGETSEKSEAVHVDVTVVSPTQSVSSVSEETKPDIVEELVEEIKSPAEEVIMPEEQPSVEEDDLDQDLKLEMTKVITEVLVDADKQSPTEESDKGKSKARKQKKKNTTVEKTVRTVSSSGTKTRIEQIDSTSSNLKTKRDVEDRKVKEISLDTKIPEPVHEEGIEVTTPDIHVGQLDISVKTKEAIEESLSVKDSSKVEEEDVRTEKDLDTMQAELESVTAKEEDSLEAETESSIKIKLQSFQSPILSKVDETEDVVSQTISITKKVERSVLQVDPVSGKPSEESEAVHVDVTVISPTQSVSSVTEETQLDTAEGLVEDGKSACKDVVMIEEQLSFDSIVKFQEESSTKTVQVITDITTTETEDIDLAVYKVRTEKDLVTTEAELESLTVKDEEEALQEESDVSFKLQLSSFQVPILSNNNDTQSVVSQNISVFKEVERSMSQLEPISAETSEKSVAVHVTSISPTQPVTSEIEEIKPDITKEFMEEIKVPEDIVIIHEEEPSVNSIIKSHKVENITKTDQVSTHIIDTKVDRVALLEHIVRAEQDLDITEAELQSVTVKGKDDILQVETDSSFKIHLESFQAPVLSKVDETEDISQTVSIIKKVERSVLQLEPTSGKPSEESEAVDVTVISTTQRVPSVKEETKSDSAIEFVEEIKGPNEEVIMPIIKSEKVEKITKTEQVSTHIINTEVDRIDLIEQIVNTEHDLDTIEDALQSITVKDEEETLQGKTDSSFKIKLKSFHAPILSNVDEKEDVASQTISISKKVERSVLQLEPLSGTPLESQAVHDDVTVSSSLHPMSSVSEETKHHTAKESVEEGKSASEDVVMLEEQLSLDGIVKYQEEEKATKIEQVTTDITTIKSERADLTVHKGRTERDLVTMEAELASITVKDDTTIEVVEEIKVLGEEVIMHEEQPSVVSKIKSQEVEAITKNDQVPGHILNTKVDRVDILEHIVRTEHDLDTTEAELQSVKVKDETSQVETDSSFKIKLESLKAPILGKVHETEDVVSQTISISKKVERSVLQLEPLSGKLSEESEAVHLDTTIISTTQPVVSVTEEIKPDTTKKFEEEIKVSGEEVILPEEQSSIDAMIKSQEVETITKTDQVPSHIINTQVNRIDLIEQIVRTKQDVDTTEAELQSVIVTDEEEHLLEKTDSSFKIKVTSFQAPILSKVDETEDAISQTVSITKKVERSLLQLEPLSGKPSEESEAVHVDVTVISPPQSLSSVTEETQLDTVEPIGKSACEDIVMLEEHLSFDSIVKFKEESATKIVQVTSGITTTQSERDDLTVYKVRPERDFVTTEAEIESVTLKDEEEVLQESDLSFKIQLASFQIPILSNIGDTQSVVSHKISVIKEVERSMLQLEPISGETSEKSVAEQVTSVTEEIKADTAIKAVEEIKQPAEEVIVHEEQPSDVSMAKSQEETDQMSSHVINTKVDRVALLEHIVRTEQDLDITEAELQSVTVKDEEELDEMDDVVSQTISVSKKVERSVLQLETISGKPSEESEDVDVTIISPTQPVSSVKEETKLDSAIKIVEEVKGPGEELIIPEGQPSIDSIITFQEAATLTKTEQVSTDIINTKVDRVDLIEHIVRTEQDLDTTEAELQSVIVKDEDKTSQVETDSSFKVQLLSFQTPVPSKVNETEDSVSQTISFTKKVERSLSLSRKPSVESEVVPRKVTVISLTRSVSSVSEETKLDNVKEALSPDEDVFMPEEQAPVHEFVTAEKKERSTEYSTDIVEEKDIKAIFLEKTPSKEGISSTDSKHSQSEVVSSDRPRRVFISQHSVSGVGVTVHQESISIADEDIASTEMELMDTSMDVPKNVLNIAIPKDVLMQKKEVLEDDSWDMVPEFKIKQTEFIKHSISTESTFENVQTYVHETTTEVSESKQDTDPDSSSLIQSPTSPISGIVFPKYSTRQLSVSVIEESINIGDDENTQSIVDNLTLDKNTTDEEVEGQTFVKATEENTDSQGWKFQIPGLRMNIFSKSDKKSNTAADSKESTANKDETVLKIGKRNIIASIDKETPLKAEEKPKSPFKLPSFRLPSLSLKAKKEKSLDFDVSSTAGMDIEANKTSSEGGLPTELKGDTDIHKVNVDIVSSGPDFETEKEKSNLKVESSNIDASQVIKGKTEEIVEQSVAKMLLLDSTVDIQETAIHEVDEMAIDKFSPEVKIEFPYFKTPVISAVSSQDIIFDTEVTEQYLHQAVAKRAEHEDEQLTIKRTMLLKTKAVNISEMEEDTENDTVVSGKEKDPPISAEPKDAESKTKPRKGFKISLPKVKMPILALSSPQDEKDSFDIMASHDGSGFTLPEYDLSGEMELEGVDISCVANMSVQDIIEAVDSKDQTIDVTKHGVSTSSSENAEFTETVQVQDTRLRLETETTKEEHEKQDIENTQTVKFSHISYINCSFPSPDAAIQSDKDFYSDSSSAEIPSEYDNVSPDTVRTIEKVTASSFSSGIVKEYEISSSELQTPSFGFALLKVKLPEVSTTITTQGLESQKGEEKNILSEERATEPTQQTRLDETKAEQTASSKVQVSKLKTFTVGVASSSESTVSVPPHLKDAEVTDAEAVAEQKGIKEKEASQIPSTKFKFWIPNIGFSSSVDGTESNKVAQEEQKQVDSKPEKESMPKEKVPWYKFPKLGFSTEKQKSVEKEKQEKSELVPVMDKPEDKDKEGSAAEKAEAPLVEPEIFKTDEDKDPGESSDK